MDQLVAPLPTACYEVFRVFSSEGGSADDLASSMRSRSDAQLEFAAAVAVSFAAMRKDLRECAAKIDEGWQGRS